MYPLMYACFSFDLTHFRALDRKFRLILGQQRKIKKKMPLKFSDIEVVNFNKFHVKTQKIRTLFQRSFQPNMCSFSMSFENRKLFAQLCFFQHFRSMKMLIRKFVMEEWLTVSSSQMAADKPRPLLQNSLHQSRLVDVIDKKDY